MNYQGGRYLEDCPPPPGVDSENRYHGSRDHDQRERDRSRRYEHRSRDHRHDREDRYDSKEYYREENYSGRSRYDGRSSSHGNEDHMDREERRSYRDRDRSRDYGDRDRERDRDRGRERDHSRDRDRFWDRDRERPPRDDWREEIPNSTIMIRGLSSYITEDDIRKEITRYSLQPKDIRLMRKKDTGTSRGFAFVEFNLLSEAVRWKELTQGLLFFEGNLRSTLHYSIPKEMVPSERCPSKADWTCGKCGVNNFRRRDLCFKCNTAREDLDPFSQGSDGYDEVSSYPSNTLLFRNLDVLTTEERVLSMLGQLTALPIKSLKVAKDSLTNTSRGFAFVELHSTSEATQLHDLLLSMAGNFFVDGRQVTVSYARRSLTAMNGSASANAASVALAAAQWTNQGASYVSSHDQTLGISQTGVSSDSNMGAQSLPNQPPGTDLGSVVVGGVTYQRYPVPDTSLYKYDVTSGYYYDPVTGLYYDSNSHYYYNSDSQQYLYWDGENQTYLPAPSSVSSSSAGTALAAASNDPTQFSSQTVPANDTSSTTPAVVTADPQLGPKPEGDASKEAETPSDKGKGDKKQDKVKIAKKIAKDMEKWAKTLNQKKENAKMGITLSSPQIDMSGYHGSSADAGFAVLEKRASPAERQALIAQILQAEKEKQLASLVAAYGGESDSEPEAELHDEGSKALEIMKAEELKLTDWTKIACLMCKRQFPTTDALVRHQQLSDLHKQNLEMIKLAKLTPMQAEELEKKERDSGYRDRAKERRKKFGQPDDPPPNKLKSKYLKAREEPIVSAEQPTKSGIGSDNIGNKMLKAMGWSEGQGLGKSGQGMSGIIEVQQRSRTAGLGMKGSTYGALAGDSYKEAVKKAMQARYNEISDS